MTIVNIIALIAAWLFFYSILKNRGKRLPKVKATIITFMFAALIFSLVISPSAYLSRSIFAFNKQGEIQLNLSPLKIPPGMNNDYCKQFRDQSGRVIQEVSVRKDGRYCGKFWQFHEKENIILPYKILNSDEIIYWASPTLNIIGSMPKKEN